MKSDIIYKLLIIDDHPIVAEGIAAIASQQKDIVCKRITCMDDLLPVLASETFDLCISALEFPDTNGFQIIQLLQEKIPACKILIYTMHEEHGSSHACLNKKYPERCPNMLQPVN